MASGPTVRALGQFGEMGLANGREGRTCRLIFEICRPRRGCLACPEPPHPVVLVLLCPLCWQRKARRHFLLGSAE